MLKGVHTLPYRQSKTHKHFRVSLVWFNLKATGVRSAIEETFKGLKEWKNEFIYPILISNHNQHFEHEKLELAQAKHSNYQTRRSLCFQRR